MSANKGMAAGTLVAMIITLAAFMLIASVIMNFVGQADEKEAELLCHDSIALRAATQINQKGEFVEAEVKSIPVLCKTIDKKVSGSREEIKQEIANKIARCWWMFGEGRYEELLHGSSVTALPSLFKFQETENKCFNCYALIIGNIDGGPISSDELMNYFVNTKYPKLENITYLQYLQSYGGPGRLVYVPMDEKGNALPIQSNTVYAISMAPKLKGDNSGWAGAAKITGALGGAVVLGLATGGTGWIALGGVALLSVLGVSGVKDIKAKVYGERDVSSIYIDTLIKGQEMCGSGDIAGE